MLDLKSEAAYASATMNLRNACIIAHVDHGKTTLVDGLLRQAGTFRSNERVSERIMDSMDLERERGITIQSKNASIKVGEIKVNIVDTPGHADFGGEVERIMNMVDGAILLVDAAEGPLPQTRFVLEKALKQGIKVVLVINKVDRPEVRGTNRISEVIDQTFELFLELGASEEQTDFSILYACARDGWATEKYDEIDDILSGKKEDGSLEPIFKRLLSDIPAPKINEQDGAQLLVSNLGYSEYVGRLAMGKVQSGRIRNGDVLFRRGIQSDETPLTQKFTVTQLLTYEGLKQKPCEEAVAGDILVLAGCEAIEIGDTIVSDEAIEALPRITVEKPTISMSFCVNTSPFSGQDGEAVQSRKLKARIEKEVKQNVALDYEESDVPDRFRVKARGELQLAVFMEQMRREGLEFMVGKPVVLHKTSDTGAALEPVEKLTIDVPEESVGDVTKLFQERKGIMSEYNVYGEGDAHNKRARLVFDIPTRGLLGTRSRFLSLTRGEGLMSSKLSGYAEVKGLLLHRKNGAMVADRTGKAVEYALLALEDRGVFFIEPGTQVYEGMVVGEFNKDTDLNVNVCKEKKLTNIRAASADILVSLSGTRKMALEDCIEWIDEDEWIEITPETIRIRKKVLEQNKRSVKRQAKSK